MTSGGVAPAKSATGGGDGADAAAMFAALQHNWRKVASTDNLMLLAECDRDGNAGGAKRWRSLLLGLALVMLGCTLLAWSLFSMVISKLLPPSTVPAIAAVQQDWYYCFLGPVLLPVTVTAVTANWFGLKLFKHNS